MPYSCVLTVLQLGASINKYFSMNADFSATYSTMQGLKIGRSRVNDLVSSHLHAKLRAQARTLSIAQEKVVRIVSSLGMLIGDSKSKPHKLHCSIECR